MRFQKRSASLALVEETACIGRHGLVRLMTAIRACQGSDELHRRRPEPNWYWLDYTATRQSLNIKKPGGRTPGFCFPEEGCASGGLFLQVVVVAFQIGLGSLGFAFGGAAR